MADENVIGSASVKIVADTTQYTADLAAARAQAQAFSGQAVPAMDAVSRATRNLTADQRDLIRELLAQKTSLADARDAFNRNAEGLKLYNAYVKAFTAAQQEAAVASASLGATQAKATQEGIDGIQRLSAADVAFAQQRMRLTQQMMQANLVAGEGAAKADIAAAAATLAFRTRMTKQQVAEAVAAEAQGLQFRRRMTAQAASEDEALAKRRAALIKQTMPEAAAAAKRDSIVGEAGALLGAGAISEAEHAEAIASAEANYAKMTQTAEKAATAIRGVGFSSSTTTRELIVMGREAARGNFSRLAGSATILAQGLGIMPALLSPVGLALIGVTVATVGATAATIAYANAQEHLANVAAGAGRRSGLSRSDLEGAAEQGARQSGQSEIGTRAVVEAMAEAGVQAQKTAASIAELTPVYAKLTDQKPAKATEEIAKAMGLLYEGTKGANSAVEIFQKRLGDVTESQRAQIIAAVRVNDIQTAQNILWQAAAKDLTAARDAGNGAADMWDKIASFALKAWDGIGKANDASLKAPAALVGARVAAGDAADVYLALARASASAATSMRDANAAAAASRARLIEAQEAAEKAHLQTPEGREQDEFQDLQGRASASMAGYKASIKLGDKSAAAKYLQDYREEADAISRVTDAHGNYIRMLDREHQIKQLEVQEAQARKIRNTSEVQAISEKIALLKVGDQIETNADARRAASDAGALAGAKSMRGAPRTDSFGNQLKSKEADAAAELALAKAYDVSDAAALRAEASRRALTEATAKGRTAAQEQKLLQAELNLAAGKEASEMAKRISMLNEETAARNRYNAAVASGAMTRTEADRKATQDVEMGRLQSEADAATGPAKSVLGAEIPKLRAADDAANAARDRAALVDENRKLQESIDKLKGEIAAIGKPKGSVSVTEAQNAARDNLGATMAATPEGQANIALAGQKAQLDTAKAQAEANYKITESVAEEIAKLQEQIAVIGMGKEAALEYAKTQELINEYNKAGIEIDADRAASILKLAQAYAQQKMAADKAVEGQKASLEASKALADSFESAIEGAIFDHKKFAQSAHDIAMGLDKDFLKGALTGSGPFAAMMGTGGDSSQGGLHGGVLGQLFGMGMRVPGAGSNLGSIMTPGSSPGNPLYATIVGALGGGSNPLAGLLGGNGGSSGMLSSDGSAIGNDVAGVFHTGGWVGSPQRQMPVSPRLFVGAPRLHSGLAPDEFPAILQRGERVIPRNGRVASGGVVINQTITASDAGSFRRTAGQIQRETARSMRRLPG